MNNFAKTISWFLITNKKQYLKSFVSLAVASFLLMALNTGLTDGYTNGVNLIKIGFLIGIIPFMLIIASLISSSLICNDLKTKQQRTLYMMLPTSNNNKFWARIILTLVQAFILFPLAMLLADAVQALVSFAFCGENIFVTEKVIDMYINKSGLLSSSHLAAGIISIVAVTVWGFSSYILGGFVFRKIPAILTTIIWIVFWILLAVQGAALLKYVYNHYDYMEINLLFGKELTMSLILLVVSALFTTLNIWGSYRIHKRMSIITHKWFNF